MGERRLTALLSALALNFPLSGAVIVVCGIENA